jgi:hypothetical protein
MIKQAYGEEALGHSAMFKWYKRFAQGRDSLEDDEQTGWTGAVRCELEIQDVATLVRANCSQTVDEMAAAAAATTTAVLSHGACHKILSDDLKMSHVTGHNVPRILMQGQHDSRMSICGDLINSADKDGTFLNWIITGDETWCFCMICN